MSPQKVWGISFPGSIIPDTGRNGKSSSSNFLTENKNNNIYFSHEIMYLTKMKPKIKEMGNTKHPHHSTVDPP